MTVIINGTTGIDTVQDGIVTDAKLNLTANSQEIKDSLNATGTAPIYACRAWVNFNGTGTVAIRDSGNVSSITDGGTGAYTVNFTTAMPDVNYCVTATCGLTSGAGFVRQTTTAFTTSAVQFNTINTSNTTADTAYVGVSVFR
jgi:hypothetical protein